MHFRYKLNKVINNKETRNDILSLALKGLFIVLIFPLLYPLIILKDLYDKRKVEIGFKVELPLLIMSLLVIIIILNVKIYFIPIVLITTYIIIFTSILIESIFDIRLNKDELRDAKLNKLLKK